jgi:hypothetical protein
MFLRKVGQMIHWKIPAATRKAAERRVSTTPDSLT